LKSASPPGKGEKQINHAVKKDSCCGGPTLRGKGELQVILDKGEEKRTIVNSKSDEFGWGREERENCWTNKAGSSASVGASEG